MDSSNPIPIDFNIDNVVLDSKTVVVPKFVKAMVRITKVLARTKGKLVIIYPNYFCRYIPIVVLGSYFHFVTDRKSRAGIRILLVTKSKQTISAYQRLCNSFGHPFVDFVYSGYLSKPGFRRLKPDGSSRGSTAGKIDMKYSNVFVVKPGYLGDIVHEHFDLCIVEDCQIMLSKRYYDDLEKLIGSGIPVLGVMTVPEYRVAKRLQSMGFRMFGWDEEMLSQDAKFFNDAEAFGVDEIFIPAITIIDLPLDEYHKSLNFAWSAYAKAKTASRGQDNEILDRIFIEISKVMHDLMNMAFSWEMLCELQEGAGKFSLIKRMALIRGFIAQLPKMLNEKLELETILNFCERTMSFTPTKQKYYEDNLNDSTVHFVATPDEMTARALKLQFPTKRGLTIITPETKDQIRLKQIVLNGLTGKTGIDYRILKLIKSEKIRILAYTHEREIIQKFERNRANIKELLGDRIQVYNAMRSTN